LTCPSCQAVVPDRSAFCLACGARLAPRPRPETDNGAGGAHPPPAEPATATPRAKQAYSLSFGPLVDERLRYRVARWVVDQAPAYELAEVQDELQQGTFLTFLALTSGEADLARRGIEGLGVNPALLRLAPATMAQMLLTERRPRREATTKRSVGLGDWRALLAAAVGLLVFGLVVVRFMGGRAF
jgi:hypothetical protein